MRWPRKRESGTTLTLPSAESSSVSFEVQVRYPRFDTGLRRLPGQTFRVFVRLPDSIRIEDQTPPQEPGAILMANPFCEFRADGEFQLELAPYSRTYVRSRAATHVSEIETKMELTKPLALDILFANAVDVVPSTPPSAPVPEGGEKWFRVAEKSPMEPVRYFCVEGSFGLISKILFLHNAPRGTESPMMETEFTDWMLNPILPDALFCTDPPADMTEYVIPSED